MLTKRKLGKGKVRVTFQMPALEGVTQLHLVGDFNNWSMAETPMIQAPDGSWSMALTLEDNRREMGTIFYTIGSKKELKDAGLIEGKGGDLGIGKTYKPTGNIDESRFTAMDTDQETGIQIPSEKARVLTNQPLSSYELQTVGQQMELRILDPKAFRTVKHVIIMAS